MAQWGDTTLQNAGVVKWLWVMQNAGVVTLGGRGQGANLLTDRSTTHNKASQKQVPPKRSTKNKFHKKPHKECHKECHNK